MMKKLGTQFMFKSQVLLKATLYLTEDEILTPHRERAKTFRASAKLRKSIKSDIVSKYPQLKLIAVEIERWSDNV